MHGYSSGKLTRLPLSTLETTHSDDHHIIEKIPASSAIEVISNSGYEALYPPESPASLSWSGLTVSTIVQNKVGKYLLKCVSGQIGGGLWAIMGSSGSGKTTFLSAISMRLETHKMKLSGTLRLNGRPYSKRELKSMSGYVMQDDLLSASFTVGETLSYTAELRMPVGCSHTERRERENYVMKLMGITHCRNVLVGDSRNKGISGGERKRLCIAMELLMKPSLLFLDEPTSGLDSATALSVLCTLKRLTSRGECTVVSTIHQPQSKIYSLFDNLILMRKGHMVYQGAADKTLLFFDRCGFPCPALTNPADHIIHVLSLTRYSAQEAAEVAAALNDSVGAKEQVSVCDATTRYTIFNMTSGSSYRSISDTSDMEPMGEVQMNPLNTQLMLNTDIGTSADSESSLKNAITVPTCVMSLPEALGQSATTIINGPTYLRRRRFIVPDNLQMGSDKPEFIEKQSPIWPVQFEILLRRSLHSHMRRWDILAMNLLVTILVAFFTCMSVWNHIGTHKPSGSKRQAALFFCVIHQGIVASLQGSHSFPLERALMLRERAAGTYYISAYFAAKTVADMCVQLVSPVIYTIIVYPVIGFAPTASQFFTFMLFMVLDSCAATSLTAMISCLCVGIELSTVVAAGAYEISRLYGGWFISPAQISLYPEWRFADALSYIKYSFVGVSLNENRNLLLTCLPSEMTISVVAGQTVAKCVIAPLNKAPYSGDAYNAYYGYDGYSIGSCVGILILFIVVLRVISYLGLRFIKR